MAVHSDLEHFRPQFRLHEGLFYSLVLLMLLLLTLYLQHQSPVLYVHLISEDRLGEYFTCVAFAVASLAFLSAGFGSERSARRFLFLMAFLSFGVAGEEISWGQRIFGLDTPEVLQSVNWQGEITLHNIGPLQRAGFHEMSGILLQILLVASALKGRLSRKLAWIDHLPLPSLQLWPAAVIVSFLLITQPMVKGDEISEASLALFFLIWALEVSCETGRLKRFEHHRMTVLALTLVGVVGSAALLSSLFGMDMGWRYNITAIRDYPNAQMMEQSRVLFDYMISNPQLIQEDTIAQYHRLHR